MTLRKDGSVKNKLSLLVITILMAGMLSGCSALFFDHYYSEKEFQGNQSIDLDSDVRLIHNYAELRRLVFDLMNNHEESTALRFAGYTGNVVSDIASVCNAVKTESAYGAYCVDYISYDLRQIVSYYEATITISYKYTTEELQLLTTTNNHESFCELLAEQLAAETPKVVVRVNNGVSDQTSVMALVEQTIREHPLSLTYYPEYTVKIFSGNSSQKIYEVNVTYDEGVDNKERVNLLTESISSLLSSVLDQEGARLILSAAEQLRTYCVFDRYAGKTAYDALIHRRADSEGIASAFKAVCDRLEVECLVVDGKLNRETHFWNILKIDDAYYHFDISALGEKGGAQCLFQSDADQQVNYWWDQSVYPDCEGDLTFFSVKSF